MMSNNYYKQKYLKYKQKYLKYKQKGGYPFYLLENQMSLQLFAVIKQFSDVFSKTILQLPTNIPVYNIEILESDKQRILASGGAVHNIISNMIRRVQSRKLSIRSKLETGILRRIAVRRASETPEGLNWNAECLKSKGECVDAVELLEKAIAIGHLPSRADLAWMLIEGREGVVMNQTRAFELVNNGIDLLYPRCRLCSSVLALCYYCGYGCDIDKDKGRDLGHTDNRYGMYVEGIIKFEGVGSRPANDYQAARYYYEACAKQGLDKAQFILGHMYYFGRGEGLQWYKLAASQGYPNHS